MSMQEYGTLTRDVIMLAPHCPEHVAEHAIRATVIDFCKRTLWWTYKSDPIDLVADEKAYDIEVPNGTEPISVIAAWYDSMPLWPLGRATKNRWHPLDPDSRRSRPMAFTQSEDKEVILSPVPEKSESGMLVLLTAIRPKRSSTSADAEMLERWFDCLVDGALARVYAIPNQPFTSPDMSLMRQKTYRAGVTDAKIDASKALTTASLRVVPRQP